MLAQDPHRDALLAARAAGDPRAILAALEPWLAPTSLCDEALLELLVELESPVFAERKQRARIEDLLDRAVIRATVDPSRVSPELQRMALDRWQASGRYHPQTACDLAARLLSRDPADADALDLYIFASVADAYAHRGTDLADIAARADDPRLRGRLLLAHAFVRHVVSCDHAATADAVRRALAADPALDYDAMRRRVLQHMGATDDDDRDDLPPRRSHLSRGT